MPRHHRRTHTFNGKTIDRTFTTAKLANEWKAEMVRLSERAKAGLPTAASDQLFREAAARWIRLRSVSCDYWMQDEAKMRKALVPALGDRYLRTITKSDCELALHRARAELKLSGATFNRYRTCLHTFFEHALDEGLVEVNPVARVARMQEVERGAHVPDHLIRAYLERAKQETRSRWFYPLVVFAMNAGPRPGELLGFYWSDYDPSLNRMRVCRRFQAQLRRIKEGTKGGGARFIPLNALSIQALEELRQATPHAAPTDLIFHTRTGRPVNSHNRCEIHRRICRAVGLADTVRFYDITRHKFASVIAAEYGLKAAQELLGHASSQTTERYAHADQDHLINRAALVQVGAPIGAAIQ
jgi:integrase